MRLEGCLVGGSYPPYDLGGSLENVSAGSPVFGTRLSPSSEA